MNDGRSICYQLGHHHRCNSLLCPAHHRPPAHSSSAALHRFKSSDKNFQFNLPWLVTPAADVIHSFIRRFAHYLRIKLLVNSWLAAWLTRYEGQPASARNNIKGRMSKLNNVTYSKPCPPLSFVLVWFRMDDNKHHHHRQRGRHSQGIWWNHWGGVVMGVSIELNSCD